MLAVAMYPYCRVYSVLHTGYLRDNSIPSQGVYDTSCRVYSIIQGLPVREDAILSKGIICLGFLFVSLPPHPPPPISVVVGEGLGVGGGGEGISTLVIPTDFPGLLPFAGVSALVGYDTASKDDR